MSSCLFHIPLVAVVEEVCRLSDEEVPEVVVVVPLLPLPPEDFLESILSMSAVFERRTAPPMLDMLGCKTTLSDLSSRPDPGILSDSRTGTVAVVALFVSFSKPCEEAEEEDSVLL
jgi:hypothetical protein